MVIFLRRLTIRGQPKKWGDKSERLLTKRATHPIDPQETFTVAVALRQISERSGRTTKRLAENYPAIPAV